jgi:hypothetical protein
VLSNIRGHGFQRIEACRFSKAALKHWHMEDEPEQPAYEITGPDEHGLIRMKMPNLNPEIDREFFCVTLGTNKEVIAEAMCRWLSIIDFGECH